jgi:prolipoprotein diacylglyceryl transferase
LGFVLGYQFVKWRFRRDDVNVKLLDNLAVYLEVGTIVGARLGHCIFYDWDYFQNHLLEILLPFRFTPSFEFIGYRGLASHGGGAGVIIALLVFAWREKISKIWILDTIALVIPLAAACIRLGNLMNSEIIGNPTNASWAFIFQSIDNIPRHPAQLYEALSYLVIFGILFWLDKKQKFHKGFVFGLMLVLMFTARFFIEFVKADQSAFEADMDLNMGQWLSIPYFIIGWVFVWFGMRKLN